MWFTSDALHSGSEIRQQQNVSIQVAEQVVLGELFRLGKQIVHQRSAGIAARHLGDMPQAELARHFRRALVIAK